MKKIIRIVILCIPLSFSSCLDILRTYWSEGKYEVGDSPSDPTCKDLYYNLGDGAGIGRVMCVSHIGSNNRYIIAASKNGGKKYWILDKENDGGHLNADQIVDGPFNLNDFNAEKAKLGISSLSFDEEFE